MNNTKETKNSFNKLQKPDSFDQIRETTTLLKKGAIGLLPFDTIWGLGAIINEQTVKKIFKIKQRPINLPLIVLIPDLSFLKNLTAELTPWQKAICKKVWPGPVTLILPKNLNVPNTLTANKPTIGIRLPNFTPLNQLLKTLNEPLISTSANLSGQKTATNFADIPKEITNHVDFIYNKITPQTGQASTIIDCTTYPEQILRNPL